MAIFPDELEDGDKRKSQTDDVLGEGPPPTGIRSVRRQQRRAISAPTQNLITPMRSIRRGSLDWQTLIRPFVSDLCFRCLTKRRSESDISFQNWSGNAAVLFVDLSSYSKITSRLAHRGAYVLSNIVNAYLDRLLKIAKGYGGDVVKFAGDAIVIVWEASSDKQEDLASSVHCAAQCVMAMQEKAGSHPVEGTDLEFQIHCGLCCGELDTEIFVAPTNLHMQRLYHAVGGEPLQEIGDLVEMASAGEVCVSKRVMDCIGTYGTFRRARPHSTGRILEKLQSDDELDERVGEHIDRLVRDREGARLKAVEEDFIHPGVLKLLTHSGQAPTQIAQMRNLCVLFIAMTSTGNPVNWLMEIQGVLDTYRCPIIQIIDDDKGVHVVAAINLYESVPEATILALDICSELVAKQVGCAVGLAMGSSFCGVTGSATVSCRWDITGAAVVRAARLMQYALQNDMEVAIDSSVYRNSSAAFRMCQARADVYLKGTTEPIRIYKLAYSSKSTATMILETMALADVHRSTVDQITEILVGSEPRGVVIVTGPPFAGKKAVFQRAAGLASVVPVLHICDHAAGHLQLARTIATWFSHYQNTEVRDLAKNVMEHLERRRWSRAHDECILLVNKVIGAGYCGCFVVDRCQFLDDFSVSLIRECLDIRLRSTGSHKIGSIHESLKSSLSDLSGSSGRMFFLCTHVPLYHWRSAECFVRELKRTRNFHTPVLEIGAATERELAEWLNTVADLRAEPEWLSLYRETTGGMLGYFNHRVKALRLITSQRLTQGKTGVSAVTENLSLFVPPKMARINKRINAMMVSAELSMRYTQIYDELPPRFQTFMKVVTLANRTCHFKCPMGLMKLVLLDLITDDGDGGGAKHSLDSMAAEMEELYLIKLDEGTGCGQQISVYCPALSDVVYDVCTPIQIEYISRVLIDRLKAHASPSFRVSLVLAALYGNLGRTERQIEHWQQSYEQALEESPTSEQTMCRMKEIIEEEIESGGHSSKEILGDNFCFSSFNVPILGHSFLMCKSYCAPFSLGPMGHSLTVITRFAAREISSFHDATPEEMEILRCDARSAFERYQRELREVEAYMTEKAGCGATSEEIDAELKILEDVVRPASTEGDVYTKVDTVLKKVIPDFVGSRLSRLYYLTKTLRKDDHVPCIVTNGPTAICEAYKALTMAADRSSGLQDALVTMATMNWNPTQLPEYLPVPFYQTTATIRDQVLRRMSDDEITLLKHQHSIDDFEAFLLTTALLNDSCTNCRGLSVEGTVDSRSSWLSSQRSANNI